MLNLNPFSSIKLHTITGGCNSSETPIIKFNPHIDPQREDASFEEAPKGTDTTSPQLPSLFCRSNRPCLCGRRRFIQSSTASMASLLQICSSYAFASDSRYTAMLNKVHPPRPDWYEEFYALVLDSSMDSYEAEVAKYKSQIFANLRGRSPLKVLEIGIGSGPNLKYYGGSPDVQVYGVDPNKKMEKYARIAAIAAGLPPQNFEFRQAVGEAIPMDDASVDAVVGTLVLCSVKDVNLTLQEVKRVLRPGGLYLFVEHVAAKDGTSLRLIQNVLDPLQQIVADGCHLTRETSKDITQAGFSSVDMGMVFLSNAFFINPQVYGIALKGDKEEK